MNPSGATTTHGDTAAAIRRWVGAFVWLALSVAGGLALWHGLEERQTDTARVNWPKAEAKVLNARVKTSSKPGGSQRDATYQVILEYTYAVEGKTYTGTSPAPRQISDDEERSAAQAIADSFTPGSPVRAYYRVDRPAVSRLSRVESVSSESWLWFVVVGSVLIPASLVGIWWTLARAERHKAAPAGAGPTVNAES